jgi:hypothetical protein
MSKVLKDLGVSLLAIYCQYYGVELVNYHNVGMVLIALLASWPFWLRMRQCAIQIDCANDSISKIPPTLNLIKYFTAFPPIWLGKIDMYLCIYVSNISYHLLMVSCCSKSRICS